MAANNAEVSSEALSGLQVDLTQLSNSLHEIFDLMSADMSQVGEAWRDGKYEEFVNGYRPQINECEEISVRYHDWCTRILSPAIERVVEVEQSNVGGDGSTTSVSGGSDTAGAGVTGTTDTTSSAKNSNVSGFNIGTKRPEKDSPGAMIAGVISSPQNKGTATHLEGSLDTNVPQSANEACKIDFGENSHAVMADPNDPSAYKIKITGNKTSGKWSAGGKLGGKVGIPGVGEISAGAEGGYTSGNEAITSERDIAYKCVENN